MARVTFKCPTTNEPIGLPLSANYDSQYSESQYSPIRAAS
jgi:hypothetical protein